MTVPLDILMLNHNAIQNYKGTQLSSPKLFSQWHFYPIQICSTVGPQEKEWSIDVNPLHPKLYTGNKNI